MPAPPAVPARARPEAPGGPGDRAVAVAAVVAGVLLGSLDFVWIRFVPFPLGGLGNSSAVWAVAAFAFGHWVRAGRVRAALGAAALLVLAVPSYHVAATLIQGDDPANAWATPSLLWMAFGVLAGVVFGVAGVWARGAGWRRTVGAALPAAVLFAEALLRAGRFGDPSRDDAGLTGEVLLAVALGLLTVAVVPGTLRQRVTAGAAALPLALLGLAAFRVGGFE